MLATHGPARKTNYKTKKKLFLKLRSLHDRKNLYDGSFSFKYLKECTITEL